VRSRLLAGILALSLGCSGAVVPLTNWARLRCPGKIEHSLEPARLETKGPSGLWAVQADGIGMQVWKVDGGCLVAHDGERLLTVCQDGVRSVLDPAPCVPSVFRDGRKGLCVHADRRVRFDIFDLFSGAKQSTELVVTDDACDPDTLFPEPDGTFRATKRWWDSRSKEWQHRICRYRKDGATLASVGTTESSGFPGSSAYAIRSVSCYGK